MTSSGVLKLGTNEGINIQTQALVGARRAAEKSVRSRLPLCYLCRHRILLHRVILHVECEKKQARQPLQYLVSCYRCATPLLGRAWRGPSLSAPPLLNQEGSYNRACPPWLSRGTGRNRTPLLSGGGVARKRRGGADCGLLLCRESPPGAAEVGALVFSRTQHAI